MWRNDRLAEALGVEGLYLKDETMNPTWSFKDRGSSVGVSKALEIGSNGVGCVSTGNMAASLSAYAAKAGLKCLIMCPSSTPQEKIVQTLLSGAEMILVDKPYPEIYDYGMEIGKEYGIYWVHNIAPMRVEGQKTSSYEIFEQMGVPDKLIIPTGSGGNLSAHWKAWKELHALGYVEELPSMVAVQAEGCCPIVDAFEDGKKTEHFGETSTIASSIANPRPPKGDQVLNILEESGGSAEKVSDKEILKAQKLLAQKQGSFVEPASAAPLAALIKLSNKGNLEQQKIAMVLTGSGLKDTKSATKNVREPIRVNTWDKLEDTLKRIWAEKHNPKV